MTREPASEVPSDISKAVILICVLLVTYLMASGAVREWITNPLDAKPMYFYENGGQLK